MEKRGSSQLDWAISLAVFTLFIAWFFIMVRPQLEGAASQEVLQYIVKKGFLKDYSWTVERIPVFISSPGINAHKPIFLNFTYPWEEFGFSDNSDFIREGLGIILLANHSTEESMHWLIRGINGSREDSSYIGIIAERDWATTSGNFSLGIKEYLPYAASYREVLKINSTHYMISGERFDVDVHSFRDYGIAAMYFAGNDAANITTYIYAKNSEVHTFIDLNPEETGYEFTISYVMANYSNYFSDNVNFGSLLYAGERSAKGHEFDYITFYNQNDSLSMFFSRNVTFSMMPEEDKLHVNISFFAEGSVSWRLIFHDGDFTKIKRQDYTYRYGMPEEVVGLYEPMLSSFNYTDMKEKWKFPSESEFQILIWKTTKARTNTMPASYRLGREPDVVRQVTAQRISAFILDEKGELAPATVQVNVW